MTIKFPDLSHYKPNVSLAGQPALITKASQGDSFVDPTYLGYKGGAAARGIPFAGYHWVESSTLSRITDQAAHALKVIGKTTPMMADIEVLTSSTGRQTWPTFDEALEWCHRVLDGGGRLTLGYIPEWFWAGKWGRRSLKPFADLGLALISSQYRTYADDGPGWDPYGGWTPAIWQFTSSATIGAVHGVDMNAFRGTAEQLRALFDGGLAAGDQEVGDMATVDLTPAAIAAVRDAILAAPIASRPAGEQTDAGLSLAWAARGAYIRAGYVANTAVAAIEASLKTITDTENAIQTLLSKGGGTADGAALLQIQQAIAALKSDVDGARAKVAAALAATDAA